MFSELLLVLLSVALGFVIGRHWQPQWNRFLARRFEATVNRGEIKRQLACYLNRKLPVLRERALQHCSALPNVYLPQALCDALQEMNALQGVLDELEEEERDILLMCTSQQNYRVFLKAPLYVTEKDEQ